MSVAVVTDSTAYLPAELSGAHRLTIVPLTVVINGAEGLEGSEIAPAEVAQALAIRRSTVSTSRPAPEQFVSTYRRLLDAGADGVVSVHLSAKLSGTYDAAQLAAAEIGPQVTVVDSGSTGMGLGFAALAAGAAATRGDNLDTVRRTAVEHADRTAALFYVDTLEFLRRGGRIGAASALLGTALSVKPILHVVDGEIVVRDKVRTAGRALARLVDLAVETSESGSGASGSGSGASGSGSGASGSGSGASGSASGGGDVDIAVHHLGAPDRAAALADAVAMRIGDRLRDCYIAEIGAVVAAHVGPGFACVVVHRRSP